MAIFPVAVDVQIWSHRRLKVEEEQVEKLGPGCVILEKPPGSITFVADFMFDSCLLEMSFPRALLTYFFLFALNDLDVQVPAGAL